MAAAPVAQLARDLRDGRRRATDVAEAVIAARSAGEQDPGPYVTFEPDRIRAEAAAVDAALAVGRDAGPLMGVPVSVKDLYGVPGYPTLAGTPTPLPDAWTRPGPVVQDVLRNLAVVTGKTHTVEFAFGGIGANAHHGTPRNPRDPSRVPGGSSSGAAVSLAEGSAWIALGTDTAGSVRIPAAWTGQVGFKTSAGRWSTDGIVPLSSTLDTAGVLARTVADARWAMAALDPAHPDPDAPLPAPSRLRLGVLGGPVLEGCSPGVVEAVQDAVGRWSRAGVSVVDATLPQLEPALAMFGRGTVAGVELWAFLNRALPQWIETLEPRVRQRVESAEQMTAREYLDRRTEIAALRAAAPASFADVDAFVCPTVANTPPVAAALEAPDAYRAENLLALRNTSVANTLGCCAVTVPVGTDAAGLPVGCMLVGARGDDVRLLHLAAVLEGCA